MNYFIFDFTKDDIYVESFLSSAALAHGIDKKTKEWFKWKFEDGPFGKAILACARSEDLIIGCVAFGLHDFVKEGILIKGGWSYETFVHPDYRGLGIFNDLIALAESEARLRGLSFVVNFPNSSSLPGFKKKNWQEIDIFQYRIRFTSKLKVITNISSLMSQFKCDNDIVFPKIDITRDYSYIPPMSFTGLMSSEYLNWRLGDPNQRHYSAVSCENSGAIIRLGNRGKLRECQILYTYSVDKNPVNLNKLFRKIKEKLSVDIVSILTSSNKVKRFRGYRKFIHVPSQVNMTFKKLTNDPEKLDFSIYDLDGLNFHTY